MPRRIRSAVQLSPTLRYSTACSYRYSRSRFANVATCTNNRSTVSSRTFFTGCAVTAASPAPTRNRTSTSCPGRPANVSRNSRLPSSSHSARTSVYAFFARWRDTGLVTELHDRLREAVRAGEGRSAEPSAGVVDSQSVKADATVTFGSRGFDAGKKINGRKRHLLTDTLGLLLAVLVTPASVTDRDGARSLLPAAAGRFRRLARVCADGGYTGHLTAWTSQHLGLVLDIARRSEDVRGFQALPRRWVVERSFAWFLRSRRLVRDYERRPDTSEAVIRWSMIALM